MNIIRFLSLHRVFLLMALLSVSPVSTFACGQEKVSLHISVEGQPPLTLLVERAATADARERGLMFRRHLGPREGMWFIFPEDVQYPFWMKNTYLSLDLIFVSATGHVVDLILTTKPRAEIPLVPGTGYRYVLEVPAGFAARYHIKKGSRIVMGGTGPDS